MRSFFNFSFHQNVQLKEDELDVASRMHSKSEKCMQIFCEKMKEMPMYKMSIPLEDLSIGRGLIKLTQSGREWTAFIWS
jgi:hypothetical protein